METNTFTIKTAKQLQFTLVTASILMGLLAGETFDRLVIGFHAWKYVDITSWANYSRHADLGNGIIVYPIEAIGGSILLLISSIILLRNKSDKPHKLSFLQIHLATLVSLVGLFLTFLAGPFMLSVKHLNDPDLLQNAFDKFYYWSTFRGIAHILSFIFSILGMVTLFGDRKV